MNKIKPMNKLFFIFIILAEASFAGESLKPINEFHIDRANTHFRNKFKEQMQAICSNPNLKALQEDKEQMMKMIIGNLFATPVAQECSQVKCDSSLFKTELVDCNMVFACSKEASELSCMPSNKSRLEFSLKNIDAKTYEEFAQFYLDKNSKYTAYLAKKNPELFKCDVSKFKISESKSIPSGVISEVDLKSFEEADKILHSTNDFEKYKDEISKIKSEHDFKKFLLDHFYSIDPKNERRFLGYMLKRKEATFPEFKVENYFTEGKINLEKVQNTLEQKFASTHCNVREKLSERLISASAKTFAPVTMNDQELIGEIMRFKNKRHADATKAEDYKTQMSNVTQACLLESVALESFLNTDRSIENPGTKRSVSQFSSHSFAEMFGVDPLDSTGQKNESRIYTESSGSNGNSSIARDDEIDGKNLVQTSTIKDSADKEASSSMEKVANSFNEFQNQIANNNQQTSFNHIFNSNFTAGAITKEQTKENEDNSDSATKTFGQRAFSDMTIEELNGLKEQTLKEIREKTGEQPEDKTAISSPDSAIKTNENPEVALLKKRLAELEKRLQDKNLASEKSNKTVNNFFAQNKNNSERKIKGSQENDAKRVQQTNIGDYSSARSTAAESTNPTNNANSINSASNLKFTTTKSLAVNSNQSEGEKVLIAANINPTMLDFIYQKISDHNQEAFILETTPGMFVEVVIEKDKDGKILLDKNGKPIFSLLDTKDKNKLGNRKISSLPVSSDKSKRNLKETKNMDSVTRQLELNKLLKTNKKD